MVLRVTLLPGQRSYRPGGTLKAKIEAANDFDPQSSTAFNLLIASLTVECIATERIDRGWIALAYGADVPPKEKDTRRESREIFHTPQKQLATDFRLSPGEQRAWNIRMPLPDWLPPSFSGKAARYSFILAASIRFSGSPAAMRLLSHHLSLEQVKRGASARQGSLLHIPSSSMPKPLKSLKGDPLEPPREQTAVVRMPILVLPAQRLQSDLADRRMSSTLIGVLTGEDAELQPIAYSLGSVSGLEVEAQEVRPHEVPAPKQRSLPRGVSMSRSDLWNQPKGQEPLRSDSLQPIDAWPSTTSPATAGTAKEGLETSASFITRAGIEAEAALQRLKRLLLAGFEADVRASEMERHSPMPPATPMTASEPGTLRSFNLRLAEHPIARLALHAPSDAPLCLGSTLCGTLDFRSSQEAATRDPSCPKCIQVVILLETEERVHHRWALNVPAQAPTSVNRNVEDEHHELTPDTVLTHFMLSIPHSAPASFSTHLISLQWLLRFEFITVAKSAPSGWLGGSGKGTERLQWSLPILIRTPIR